MPMPTGNWENPQVYRQWTAEDSQTDYLLTDYESEKSVSIDSQFVDLKNTGLSTYHLKLATCYSKLLHVYNPQHFITALRYWLLVANFMSKSYTLGG